VDIANVLSPSSIFLATGVTPADALVAGAAAAKAGGVVLLTDDGVMPTETAAYLATHAGLTVYALGGPAAAADPAAVALVGRDRYVTGVMVAQALFGSPEAVGFASGVSWADALAGGVHIGLHGGPLLLVDPNSIDPALHGYLNSIGGGVVAAFAYGGPSSLPAAQITALSNAMGGA
jgi:ell wall binding domain 2 (CWB2)